VVERSMRDADLVIGAVLVPGGRAPVVATEQMVEQMVPGSVIVDVAVDQGGCIETTVETTHEAPVVVRHGVLHYGVGNIPAAVPHTSTYALTNATFPYALTLADHGVRGAIEVDPALGGGVLCASGQLTNEAVAEALGRRAVAPLDALP
jgi:alanine dehydrogenase